jgi:hypothetical protein
MPESGRQVRWIESVFPSPDAYPRRTGQQKERRGIGNDAVDALLQIIVSEIPARDRPYHCRRVVLPRHFHDARKGAIRKGHSGDDC